MVKAITPAAQHAAYKTKTEKDLITEKINAFLGFENM